MRVFRLTLGDITNESTLYPDGTVRCVVKGILPGQELLLWVQSLEELGHKDADEYVAWITGKAGYVEVRDAGN